MDTDSPLTPDVDLPGQLHVEADLDIDVEPGPDAEPDRGGPADTSDDPEVGNTLIRPENS
ncbi:MAG: hypothetical protein ACRYG2_06500 [Janthinobacterium lividum]